MERTDNAIATTRKSKRKYWQRHISAWQASQLSQSEYCRRNKIALNTFGAWKRKLVPSQTNAGALVELPVEQLLKASAPWTPSTPQPSGLALILNQSIRIEIAEDFSAKSLRRLVQALESL